MKQRGIASFFGGAKAENPPRTVKVASAKPEKSLTPGKKSSPEVLKDVNTSGTKRPREEPQPASPSPAPEQAGKGRLKRIRKASTATDVADAPQAAELIDADGPDSAAPPTELLQEATDAGLVSAKPERIAAGSSSPEPQTKHAKGKQGRASSKAPAKGKKAASPKKQSSKSATQAASAAKEAVSDLEVGLSDAEEQKQQLSSSLEDAGADHEEVEEVKSQPAKSAAKPTKKPILPDSVKAIAKVEGVGLGAVAAASKHGKFDLDKLATWKAGQPVPFAFLADTFEAIAEESKRLVITSLLVNCFRTIIATTPADLLPTVYLCTNQVAPSHEGIELGIGDATLVKALAAATGRQESLIKKQYGESGDLGTVASAARATQRTMFTPSPLTIPGVLKTFKEIASTEGSKSMDKKKGLIQKLVVGSRQNETGYIMRALQGKLRIGLAEQTVLVALAHAVLLHRQGDRDKDSKLAGQLEEASQAVKYVYSQCPSYDQLVPALLNHPVSELKQRVAFVVGVPVKPMLAKPTTGVSEVLDKFQDIEFTCEYKYDGERAQVHISEGGKVSIYSRNSENNTAKYPDLAADVPKLLKEGCKSVVLDCEAVAYDRITKKILPFQVLSTRARKDVKVADIKVQVCLYAFDCLYLNGQVLVDRPLTERREALYSAIQEKPGELFYATAKTSRELDELSTFLNEAVNVGTEGLIVKTLDSTYEPSKRSAHWLKLKKDYLEGVGDTFDLVPIGAWYGKGKRVGVFGAFLLAIYNEETEEYQTISKIGTGFSEEQLKELADLLRPLTISDPRTYYRSVIISLFRPYYRYGETLLPDVWFDPKVVWEVKAADLSISPVHQAAAGMADAVKGISIRFPRLVRVRDDKNPEQATNAEQVVEMYQKQPHVQGNKGSKAAAEDDD
ncbi:TPA: hypothetical protein ACH3X2_005217 [Trebouxia sp. C0005]